MKSRLKILFLCTGNSCRSQMAEGWTRRLKADCIEAFSAGTKAQSLDPLAVQAMAEAGVDISRQKLGPTLRVENILRFSALYKIQNEAVLIDTTVM